jgi:hypothetical protein
MNFKGCQRYYFVKLRELTKNFELAVVTAADSKFSVDQMGKSISFRNSADKIANKNIEYNIA